MIRTLCALALTTALLGCSLDRPFPDKSFYALASPHLDPVAVAGTATLRVNRARLAAPFGSRALQYRVGPNRYEPSYYENWADDPGELIATAIADSIASNGTFAAVVDDGSVADSSLTLELFVAALYADVTIPSEPKAVLRIRAALLDTPGAVLMSREYEATTPAASRDAARMVQAWNTSLESVVREMAADLGRIEPVPSSS